MAERTRGWIVVAVVAANAVAALAVVLLALPVADVLRALLGLSVVLVPGAVFAFAVGPRIARRLDPGIVLVGLAVATVVLGGLVLNLLPPGLHAVTWLAFGFGLLVVAAVLPGWGLVSIPRPSLSARPALGTAAVYAAAALLLVAGMALSSSREAPAVDGFTQTWLVPADAVVGGTAEGATAQLGVRNLEGVATTYRVELLVDGEVVESWPEVPLAPGDSWTTDIGRDTPDDASVEARVFKADDPESPYRVVRLTVPEPAG